jgi:hypothetical protein
MVQLDAEFHFLQNGTTMTLYDALTPLPWPHFVFHLGYGANYVWSQLFNVALTSTSACTINTNPLYRINRFFPRDAKESNMVFVNSFNV